jgi:ribosomal protein S18 acetylase RimI-like enzyme
MDETESVGIIVFWVFESFLFIEHIAINEECRSKGYGTKAIELIKKEYNLPIILEAEFPETEIQKKRIRFYENSGFKINSYSYIQPSYHEDEGVPLQILSFPEALNKEAFDLLLKETRAVVYEITDFKL